MFGPLGVPEILFILAIALLIFGPRRLPELGRTLGKAMGEFRRATTELKRSINTEIALEDDDERPRYTRTARPADDATGSEKGAEKGGEKTGEPGGRGAESGQGQEIQVTTAGLVMPGSVAPGSVARSAAEPAAAAEAAEKAAGGTSEAKAEDAPPADAPPGGAEPADAASEPNR